MQFANNNYHSQNNSLYHFYFPRSKPHYVPAPEPPEDDYQSVELRQGRAVYKRDFSTNSMKTSYYSKVNFLPKILFNVFSLNGNLFFLVVSLIMLFRESLSPFLSWIYIAPLGFYAVCRVCKEVFFNYQKVKFDKNVNRTKVKRLTFLHDGDGTDEVAWENLEIGDVVCLRKGDYVPADLILLDSGEKLNKDNVCYTSTKLINGKKNLLIKRALKMTRLPVNENTEPNWKDYRFILSGILEYETPSSDLNDFKGVLKLTKDPRPELISNENLLLKMSRVKNTSWMIGLVVYCGNQAKIVAQADFQRRKSNFGSRVTERFNYVMIVIAVLFAMISVVAYIGDTSVKQYIKTYERYTDYVMFFYYLIQYANFVPMAIYFSLDMIEIIHFTKSKYVRNVGVRKHFITPYNPSSSSDLGTIDYILMDTTALGLDNCLRVQQIYIPGKFYAIQQEEVAGKVQVRADQEFVSGSSSASEPTSPEKNTEKKIIELPDETDQQSSIADPAELSDESEIKEEAAEKETESYEEEDHLRKETEEVKETDVSLAINLQQAMLLRQESINSHGNLLQMGSETEIIDMGTESPHNLETDILPPSLDQMPDFRTQSTNRENLLKKTSEISSSARQFERNISLKKPDEKKRNYIEKGTDGFVRDYFKDAHIEDLLRCVLLCSEARIVREKEAERVTSNFQEEKVLLNFAKSCQFTLEFIKGKKGTAMQVKTRNSFSQHHILVQSASYGERKEKFSMVASTFKGFNTTVKGSKVIFGNENIDLEEAFIYVKGVFSKVRHLLKVSNHQATAFDQIAEKMYFNGKIPIVFARRKLKKDQTQEFVKKYKNFKTNLNAQPTTLEKMFEDIEKDLEFIGMFCLGQTCITPIFNTVQTLNQAAINIWVVSNEPFDKILLLLRTYKLLTQENNHFFIDGESQESVAISVRLHMSQVRRVFELEKQTLARENISQRLNVYYNSLSENILRRMSSYVVIISGRAFEFIRNDKMTYDNFAFLCAISCRVIGFEFSSENKQALIRMVNKKFSDKAQVMAVGSTYSDVPMLNAAHIGVFCTNFEENDFLPWADIKTSDMCNLPKMLLEQGVAFTHQIDHSIYYLFYKAVALTLPLFYFNWFCSMTGTSIYDSVMLFLFNFLFTLLPILCLGVDQPFSKEYIQAFPAFYAESRYKKLHLVKKFILRVVIEGVVHATLIFYLCLYTISYSTDKDAYPGDLGMLSLSITISLVFVVDFKTFFHITKSRISLMGTITLSLTLLFGFLWMNARAVFTDRGGAHVDLNRLVRQATMIFMILFVIFICLAFSYIINNYVVVSEVANAWQLLAYKYKQGKFKCLDNTEILNVLKYKENQLSRIIKAVYKNSDKLENFVLEMLNMLGQNFSRVDMKRFSLAFPDKILERRYQYNKIQSSMWFVRLCYYIGTIIFIVSSIIIVATQDSDNLNIARFIASIVLIICCIYINTNYYKKHFMISNFIILFLVICFKLCYDYIKEDDGSMSTAILILVLSTFSLFEFYMTIILNLLLLIPFFIQQYNNYKDLPDNEQTFYIVFSNYLLLTSLAVVSIYSGLQLEKQSRNEFLASINIDTQNTTYDNILSMLVPDFVKTLLNRGIRYLAEDQGKVAILFCDICDFDDVIRERGTQVVEILDNLWRQFDKYCVEYGVQKIETVGKTYMACAGLKSTERDFSERSMNQNSTKRVVNMAIDMMNYVEETTLEGMSFRIKIGVHYGRVIAGIIGEHKPQFSLIGDSVNTTSRVCSTGEKGKVILSQEAFQEVKTRALTFTMREVEAKGKGKLKTYVLQRQRKEKKHAERAERGRNEAFRALRTLVNPDVMFDSSRMDDSSMSSHFINVPHQEILNSATLKDEARAGGEEGENPEVERATTRKKSVNVMLKSMFKMSPAPPKNDHEVSKEELEKDGVETRIQLLQASRFLLLIKDSPIKRQYQAQKYKKYRRFVNTTLILLSGIFFVQTLITLITRSYLDITATFIAIRAIFSGYLILLVLFSKCFEKHEWLERLLLFIGLMYGCIVLIYQSYRSHISADWFHKVDFMELTIVVVMGLTCRKFEFIHCLLFYILLTPLYMIFWGMNHHIDYNYLFYYYTIALYILITQYIVQLKDIRSFNLGLKQNQRYYEQNNLISQLLPIHALDKLLRATELDLTDLMEDATLLFSDISGFTKFSSSREPEEVVAMLTEMFTEFDKMCVKLGVYKVYTIGDAYIVMGFTNANDRKPEQEAHNVVKMGMAMIDIIRTVREKLGYEELEMRIGIHTGTVIGGIIGTDIVRYDLYGKDYLIGNKMESNGKEGMIQVSETTKEILENAFPGLYRFDKHKEIEVPTLGEKINGYLVYYDEENGFTDAE